MSEEKDGSTANKAADIVKKALTVGLGAVFLSEEALRGLVSEIKLPREFLSGILEGANQARRELLQGVTSQIIDKISKSADPAAVLQEFLGKNEIEFQVKVKFTPKKPDSVD